jgi:hypothetical protein
MSYQEDHDGFVEVSVKGHGDRIAQLVSGLLGTGKLAIGGNASTGQDYGTAQRKGKRLPSLPQIGHGSAKAATEMYKRRRTLLNVGLIVLTAVGANMIYSNATEDDSVLIDITHPTHPFSDPLDDISVVKKLGKVIPG